LRLAWAKRAVYSRRVRFALVFLLIASAGAEPLERSVSPSRQFIVYSENAQLRGTVSDLAEHLKRNTLSILRTSDDWKTPIVLNVQLPQANIPDVPSKSLRFSQTGAGLKLQLDVVIGENVRAFEIQREILRAILLERMYRNHTDIAAGTAYVQPPDWLLDGLLAAAPGFDRASLPSGRSSTSLEEFLRQRPNDLDGPTRELYRAGSLALVQVIVDFARSGGGLARYIDNLINASNDPLGDLRVQFPASTANDLEKLWQSRLNRLSSQKSELPRFSESEQRLAQALQIKMGAKNLTLADLVKPKLSPAEKFALKITVENLMLVGTSAHPLVRPIASEYQQIAQLLAAGKRKGASERLARLHETRRRLVKRMSDVDDYMNWFEATQLTTRSGVFDDYLRSAQRQKTETRRDAVSVYLDAIEMQTQQ
jgi:hypothetical protein